MLCLVEHWDVSFHLVLADKQRRFDLRLGQPKGIQGKTPRREEHRIHLSFPDASEVWIQMIRMRRQPL